MSTATRRPTTPAATDIDWRAQGACREVDPELFFPTAHTSGWKKQTENAKKVCAGCPVRARCLQWAPEHRQDVGVWGGLAEKERRRLHGRKPSYHKPEGMTSLEYIYTKQLPRYRALEAQGLKPGQIAIEMQTNVQTINSLRKRLAEQAQDSMEVAA